MAKTQETKGIVYIVKNKSFKEDIIKIGITQDLPRRIKELSGSNVPYPFECLYACEVNNYKEVEEDIHALCIASRVAKEFYRNDPKPVIRLLKKLSIRDITLEVEKAIETEVETEEKKEERSRASQLNIVSRKEDIKEGYGTFKELKKFLDISSVPNFKAGYFALRVASTHTWRKISYYEYKGEKYYNKEVFLKQAENEGILASGGELVNSQQ